MSLFALSGTIFSSFIILKSHLNRRKIPDEEQDLRDYTRPQVPSFGLKFGASADLMVLEEIDTGDILVSSKICGKMTEPMSMIKCYINCYTGQDNKNTDVGLALREHSSVKVIELKGNYILDYSDYISQQWRRPIYLNKLSFKDKEEHKRLHIALKTAQSSTHLSSLLFIENPSFENPIVSQLKEGIVVSKKLIVRN